jgi:hypothetical protein
MIESRLSEIRDEESKLQRALAHLGEGDVGPRSRRPPRRASAAGASTPPKSKRRAASEMKPTKRAPRGQRRDELLAAIKATPGARPSELAETIGVRPTQVSVLIAKARAEKLIVRSGSGYALKS